LAIKKYYFVDVGFMLTSGLSPPYREILYHVMEYLARNLAQISKELFKT
jgi:hypothetical protein